MLNNKHDHSVEDEAINALADWEGSDFINLHIFEKMSELSPDQFKPEDKVKNIIIYLTMKIDQLEIANYWQKIKNKELEERIEKLEKVISYQ